MSMSVLLGFWLIFWIAGTWMAKNQWKAKQPIGVGFLISLPMIAFWGFAMDYRESGKEEIKIGRTEQLIQEATFLEENQAEKVKICIAYDYVMNNATDNLNQDLFQEYKAKYEERRCGSYY